MQELEKGVPLNEERLVKQRFGVSQASAMDPEPFGALLEAFLHSRQVARRLPSIPYNKLSSLGEMEELEACYLFF